jgi:predicted acylesterase/phospholipase RssA
MGKELNTFQSKEADIIIEPDLGNIDQAAFDKASRIIAIGEETARKMLPALRKMLDLKKRT